MYFFGSKISCGAFYYDSLIKIGIFSSFLMLATFVYIVAFYMNGLGVKLKFDKASNV